MVEVVRGGAAYMLEHLFTGQKMQRGAEKVKPYVSEEEWIPEPQVIVPDDPEAEPEPTPPRERRPPRRYIEEC